MASIYVPIRRNISVFTARGGTIGYYITPDAVVVIDSQFPDTAKMLLERGHALRRTNTSRAYSTSR